MFLSSKYLFGLESNFSLFLEVKYASRSFGSFHDIHPIVFQCFEVIEYNDYPAVGIETIQCSIFN